MSSKSSKKYVVDKPAPYRPMEDAIDLATDGARDEATEGATDPRREGAAEPKREGAAMCPRSQSLSLARISMFSNGAA